MNAVMDLHVTKENELLYPLYDNIFSVEEQNAHEEQIMAHMPPETMGMMAVWMFKNLGTNDREGFLRFGMKMLPPPALGPMMQMMADVVTPREWQEMTRRIPELAKL